jgi:hypothetical protein
MDSPNNRRLSLAVIGGAVALVAGLGIAWALVAQHRGEATAPPPASRAGLVIDSSGTASTRLDSTKPLRCFVAGQLVGELTLADCAKRNGVATDALDVGLDQSGALAAADQAGAAITPLPPGEGKVVEAPQAEPTPVPQIAPQAVSGPADACWRYAAGQWRKLTPDMPLAACVQVLFAGRCEHAGEAAYGRWGSQTLRLAPGRIETSGDNRNFHPLMDQAGCPPAG